MWTIAYYEMRGQLRLRPVQLILFLMPVVVIFILGSALSGLFDTSSTLAVKLKLAYSQEGAAGAAYDRLKSGFAAERVTVEQLSSKIAVVESVKQGKADIGLLFNGNSQPQLVFGRSMENNLTGQLVVDSLLMDPDGNKQDKVIVENPLTSYTHLTGLQYFSATMLVMYLLYAGMGTGINLIEKRNKGTQERLFAQPVKPGAIIAGLLLGNGLVAGIQSLTIIIAAALLFGVNWGHHPVILVFVCLLMIACCMGLAAITARFVRSRSTIQLLFQWLIVVMTLVSGGYNPQLTDMFGNMYLFTLNHWAVKTMVNMMQNRPVQESLQTLLPLAAIAAVLAVLVWMSYRRVGVHE